MQALNFCPVVCIKREEIILEAPNKCTSCGGEEFRKIGEDSWELPGQLHEILNAHM